ncbi:MAG: DUF401 family protein [Candidatus Riflebacteria bacterium]|nr:DUF401 family protein [Candidatus Riflebacteria bacterium]
MNNDTIILFVVILLMVFLTVRGVALWLAILLAAVGLSLSLKFDVSVLLSDAKTVLMDDKFYELAVIVCLIYLFSTLLKATNRMDRMITYLRGKLKSPRSILFAFPALVGLIPMPGGAMFTAPITEEFGNSMKLSSEDKVFTNYWFRHCWELSFPLYPGIILCAGIARISPTALSFNLFPLALTAFASGLAVFFIRSYSLTTDNAVLSASQQQIDLDVGKFTVLWPIIAVIFVALAKISLIPGLTVIILALTVFERVTISDFFKLFRESINVQVVVLIYSVFLLGQVLASTGALTNLSSTMIGAGLPVWLLSFFLPFLLGLLTGVTTGFVGTVFPVLMPLWKEDTLLYMQFAYTCGLAGVFLTPAHLCLSMTQDYFKANLAKVIGIILLPVTALLIVAGTRLYAGL